VLFLPPKTLHSTEFYVESEV